MNGQIAQQQKGATIVHEHRYYRLSNPYPNLSGSAGDPYRDASVSAGGVHIPSPPDQPIAVSDGFHCSDLDTIEGVVDPTVKAVQQQGLAVMKEWIAEWKRRPIASMRRGSTPFGARRRKDVGGRA